VASNRVVERQKVFKQYKEDVRERGKPFYPYAMLHDTIMSLVVVAVIIVLAVIWKWTIPGDHSGTGSGWLGPLFVAPANPGTFSFVPRPDWYFYFLFYLLRVFKWPASVVIGTVGIPTICILLLLAIPFIDVRSERRPLRRPVAMVAAVLVVLSMGILTFKGATAKESLPSEVIGLVPTWAKNAGFENDPAAIAGAKLFASVGCTNCHTYQGIGTSTDGAPDLTAIGAKNLGITFFADYVANPAKYGNNIMPHFGEQYGGALTPAQLAEIGAFLNASKGTK
jgi:ubiquinol-cytochrome c reductase cytochrome b subunit/menaquinol-cytochrome c reductase cytochrome b/c subunit